MYDVIIAGAGPAGSTAARVCAKHGLKTLLLDRSRFPRQKPCGGAVAERALAHLDFSLPADLIERECFTAEVSHRGSRVTVRRGARFSVLVSRDRFDAYLAEKAVEAGADFSAGEGVRDIVAHRSSVGVTTVKTAHECSFLIGADGVHSIVARMIRPPLPRQEMAFALACSLPGGTAEVKNDALDMHFGIAPLGYGWDFPRRGVRSLGVMGHASRFRDPLPALEEYARSRGGKPEGVRGHFIPYGGIKRPIVRGRIALAGDAAGFGDAFLGEGIVHAIRSGRLAGEAVVRAVRGGAGPETLDGYGRDADRLIRRDLRYAYLLAKLIDRFPRTSHVVFFGHDELIRRYLDIPAGSLDYRGYWRWFLGRFPFLALSALVRAPFSR